MELYQEVDVLNIHELEDEFDTLPSKLREAYRNFTNSVRNMTNMDICPVYHNPDEGNRSDDIQGEFWICRNAMIPNPDINKDIHDSVLENAHYITSCV